MSPPVDFGALGSQAYPGRLAVNWGPMLVEPPVARSIRKKAGDRLVRLRDLAPVHSGIPTRSVKYFCVEETSDPNLLAKYNIQTGADRRRLALVKDGRGVLHVLERATLKPIIRRPRVLEGRLIVPPEAADPWRLFSVQIDLAELQARRWQHALQYIEYGARTEFRGGVRRRGGIVAQRSNVAARRIWWAVPTMPEGFGRVAWLKGRGNVHYAPELPAGVLVLDNFLYSTPPEDLGEPRLLAAIANQSWTNLMAEVYGRRAAGDGVLQTYIRELNMLPVLDPRTLSAAQSADLLAAYEQLAAQPAMAITEELQRPERQKFDRLGMAFLIGSRDAAEAAESVARALRDLANERSAKASTGRQEQQRSRRKQAFDPEPIAARILTIEGPPPDFRVSLGSLDPESPTNIVVEVAEHVSADTVEVGETLLDQGEVRVNGRKVAVAPTVEHAYALKAALTTDPDLSGPVILLREGAAIRQVTSQWNESLMRWRDAIHSRLLVMLPGGIRAGRRRSVLESLERQARLLRTTLQ